MKDLYNSLEVEEVTNALYGTAESGDDTNNVTNLADFRRVSIAVIANREAGSFDINLKDQDGTAISADDLLGIDADDLTGVDADAVIEFGVTRSYTLIEVEIDYTDFEGSVVVLGLKATKRTEPV